MRDAGGCTEEDDHAGGAAAAVAAVLAGARRMTAPSRDAARRMARHFDGLACHVESRSNDALIAASPRRPRRAGGTVSVCVVGAISLQKGYDYLLACARDVVARALPITFSIVGFTCDDERLLETGVVSITGPYEEDEVEALVRMQAADVGFLPATLAGNLELHAIAYVAGRPGGVCLRPWRSRRARRAQRPGLATATGATTRTFQ